MLCVRVLGRFEVELDGVLVDPPESRRAWSLLAWLALHPGLHPRSELAARFWPETLDSNARANLRSAIWSLRRTLGPAGQDHLTATRELVGLEPDGLRTDLAEFDQLVAARDPRSAVELCRGDLLSGFDDEWVYDPRDEVRDRQAAALAGLADEAEREADLPGAVRWTRRQLQLVPLSEDAHRNLIRRLAAAGDRPAALVAYARLRERFREDLGIEPSGETRRLAESLRRTSGRVYPGERPRERTSTQTAGADAPYPLIGRTAAMSKLLDAWRSARARRGGVVQLTGEAGIGKTRVAVELAQRAQADGGYVATCAGLDPAGAVPFGLWAELLRDVSRDLEPPSLQAPWASPLPRISPDLDLGFGPRETGSQPAYFPSPELERTRLFEGIVNLVEWAAGERPLLIIMEDVHLADISSLQLLGYVARRSPTLPLLILLTRRDLPPRADVDALEHSLRSHGITRHVALGPLTDPDMTSLVRSVAALPSEAVARVVAAADGNPLLAVESARALARGEPDVPASLRSAARASYRLLDPEARLLAELVAVAGRPLERDEADELPLERLHEAATIAVESGLLAADERRIGYRHALLSEAVYADLAGPRRAWLHETFAAGLQSCEARSPRRRAAEVARHLRLAGRDALAVEYLARAAGDARAVAALSEAADFLTEATALAPGDADLLLELAEVEAWRGRRHQADLAFDRALTAIPPDDLAAQAEAWLRRGRSLRGALCFPRAARDAYRSALGVLDAAALPAVEERAEAVAGCAWAEAVAGDAEAVEALLDQLSDLVVAGNHADLRTHDVGAARAFSLIRRGHFEESYEHASAAAEAAQRAGRPDMAYGCWANAASAAACAGDFERALEFAERGLAVVRRVLPTCEVHLLAARAHILTRLGRIDEARAAVQAEAELAERLDRPELQATAMHDGGMVAFAAADFAHSVRLLAAALDADAPVSRARARLTRAEALVRLGRLDEAEAEMRATTLEPVTPSDFPHTLVPRLTRLQGMVAAARGNRQLAVRRLTEAADSWRRYARPSLEGDDYVANLADLGRPPVEGLIEPARELQQVLTDLQLLRANVGAD